MTGCAGSFIGCPSFPVMPQAQGRPHTPSALRSSGEDREDAGHRQRGLRVDRLDLRVGVRRANEDTRNHSRPLDIGNVVAATGEKANILFATRSASTSTILNALW